MLAQAAGDFNGMAAQITDKHTATFATESTWDGLAHTLSGSRDLQALILVYAAVSMGITLPDTIFGSGVAARPLLRAGQVGVHTC
jgi:hypothetical protein